MKYIFLLLFLISWNELIVDGAESFGHDKYDTQDDVYGSIIGKYSEDHIVRPCALRDRQCMRKVLAANSNCQPAYGPAPDPFKLPVDKAFIPLANFSVTYTNLEVKGFRSAKVTEFYVNKKTGNLVIAINVQNLEHTSPKSHFSFQRVGKEPIIRSDFTTINYDSVTFTAVIPKIPHLRLDRAEIHAYVHDAAPVFAIGPKVTKTEDPDVAASLLTLLTKFPVVIQEAFQFRSSLLACIYIQQCLCDFGLDSYRNYLAYVKTKGYTQVPGRISYENNILRELDNTREY